jgi:hypothetical protein
MQSSCRRCSNWLRYVPQPSVWLPPSLLILRSERPASMHIMQHSCSVYIFIRPSIHLRICVSSFINVHLNTCNTRRYIRVARVANSLGRRARALLQFAALWICVHFVIQLYGLRQMQERESNVPDAFPAMTGKLFRSLQTCSRSRQLVWNLYTLERSHKVSVD